MKSEFADKILRVCPLPAFPRMIVPLRGPLTTIELSTREFLELLIANRYYSTDCFILHIIYKCERLQGNEKSKTEKTDATAAASLPFFLLLRLIRDTPYYFVPEHPVDHSQRCPH